MANALLWSLAAFAATFAGGFVALRLRARLRILLGVTAGLLLAVVCAEVLPESLEMSRQLGGDGSATLTALVVGFVLFHGLEHLIRSQHAGTGEGHHHPTVGMLSASALVGHSFLDGVGIGLAFQVSPTAGLTVAIAVIAHDFCDGLNTVGLVLAHRGGTGAALAMLVLDATAPLLGALSTLAFRLPPEALAIYLGFFAGFLLYIALSHLGHLMKHARIA